MSVTRPTLGRIWANKGDKADPGAEKYAQGWTAEIPTYEVLNFLQNRTDTTLLATAQRGVPEWGPDVTYEQGACAWDNLDKTVYVALVPAPNNEKPPSTNPAHWEVSTMQFTASTHQAIVKKMDDHIADKSNPHKVTANQVGTYDKPTIDSKISKVSGDTSAHVNDKGNPHKVTAAQAGGVPITGGRYTGAVGFDANDVPINAQAGDHSVLAEADRLSLRNKTAKLSIHADGSATANDKKLISEESYPEVRAREEHLYAVPEPDFHMPLVSDIHILEGVGFSEFKRNSVATYIDRTGVLRTAKVDEPRFEKEGLLIEGASTNTHAYRDYTNSAVSKIKCTCELSTNENGIQWYKQIATGDGGAYVYLHSTNSQTFELGVTYTYSLTVKRGTTNTTRIHFHTDSFPGYTNGVFNFDSGTFEQIGSGVTGSSVVRLHGGVYRISLTAVCTKAGGSRSPLVWQSIYVTGDAWFIADPQIEALPFATSYIPTNGAAVTRAADYCTIQSIGNAGGFDRDVTYAGEFNELGKSTTGYFFCFADGAYPTRKQMHHWSDNRISASNDYVRATAGVVNEGMKGLYVAAFDYGGGDITLRTPQGLFKSSTPCVNAPDQGEVPSSNISLMSAGGTGHIPFGHIRNFRIWHQALTDEQISTL